MNIRRLLLLLALLVFLPVLGLSAQDEVTIEWWSHWANEPSKVAFVEAAAADYMAANPNVTINVTWWDKNPLRDAIRSTMTAGGDEAPDITTFDSAVIEWVEAGWMVDIGDHLPWDNFLAGTDADGSYESLGIEGNYKMNLGGNVQMILYNKDIFAELGIEVPDDFTFQRRRIPGRGGTMQRGWLRRRGRCHRQSSLSGCMGGAVSAVHAGWRGRIPEVQRWFAILGYRCGAQCAGIHGAVA